MSLHMTSRLVRENLACIVNETGVTIVLGFKSNVEQIIDESSYERVRIGEGGVGAGPHMIGVTGKGEKRDAGKYHIVERPAVRLAYIRGASNTTHSQKLSRPLSVELIPCLSCRMFGATLLLKMLDPSTTTSSQRESSCKPLTTMIITECSVSLHAFSQASNTAFLTRRPIGRLGRLICNWRPPIMTNWSSTPCVTLQLFCLH